MRDEYDTITNYLKKNTVDTEYMRDARATNEWPYNKCVDIGVIMLQMCVFVCKGWCCLKCYERDGQ